MQAWAGIAIAQTALVVISLWRALRVDGRGAWKPGVGILVIAALATLVMFAEGGYWSAVALFGMIILASDALFLKSTVVGSLCTRPREETPETPEP